MCINEEDNLCKSIATRIFSIIESEMKEDFEPYGQFFLQTARIRLHSGINRDKIDSEVLKAAFPKLNPKYH